MEDLKFRTDAVTQLTFTFGTLILTIFIVTSNYDLALLAYIYFFLTIVLNLSIWISLLIRIVKDKSNRRYWTKTILLSLINIPTIGIYLLIVGYFTNIMRVNFTNTKSELIREVQIIGKESIKIDVLRPNESETLWIPINDDISINIKYKYKDSIITETVIQYIDRGKIMKYNIGQKRETRLIIK